MNRYYEYLKYMRANKKNGKINNTENETSLKSVKKKISIEKKKGGFQCIHCHAFVPLKALGTKHRNHCPNCLWSKHIGRVERLKEVCGGVMIPIGLTFKKEGINKYTGNPKQGELMVVHQCINCKKISINRLAGDDQSEAIMKIFEHSLNMPKDFQKQLKREGIDILTKQDAEEIKRQLFWKG